MEIVRPEERYLESYKNALIQSISSGTAAYLDRAERELLEIEADPLSFLAEQEDPNALGPDVKLPDGSLVPRLPGITRWMWDGQVSGEINFRWKVGTTDLPPHCLGHIGYEVFSWKRNKGYASEALRQILPEAIKLGMPFVELTTDVDNSISQKVIKNNGGILHEKFVKPAAHGGTDGLRFRIYL
ncbi:MAG: GNAT family N-acetyltransferase [Candidatus Planktophila sp.]|nr:GNAT family N-acetyltransferase [Candidatus Planktophila sp.]